MYVREQPTERVVRATLPRRQLTDLTPVVALGVVGKDRLAGRRRELQLDAPKPYLTTAYGGSRDLATTGPTPDRLAAPPVRNV